MNYTQADIDYLLSPRAIRERSRALYNQALGGKTHFRVNLERLPAVAKLVTEVTLSNYPDLKIPFHSRWGHFQAGGIDRLSLLEARLKGLDTAERARIKIGLVIVSVLLDAGAGPDWKFVENGKTIARSEGLAVASFHMFMNGEFGNASSLRADAEKLEQLTAGDISRGFQAGRDNPLIGLEGRAALLRSLGRAVRTDKTHFPTPRVGALYDFLASQASGGRLSATAVLSAVLHALGPIWPGRIQLGKTNLGDVWRHPLLGAVTSTECLMPFHKLSQWLTYSLIEPIEAAGIAIDGVNELTGLAEYRNGGLMLDEKLIELRDLSLVNEAHRPDSELVIEWRALTLVLLELIAEQVRKNLGKSAQELPLAKVLEGGTWWAGRKSAAKLRPGGGPPLTIASDGTVF